MHASVDVVAAFRMWGNGLSKLLPQRCCGADAVSSGGGLPVGMVRANVTLNGTDVVSCSWPTTKPRSSHTTT
jgi:hypothetical protein